jgi:hypothetical protein
MAENGLDRFTEAAVGGGGVIPAEHRLLALQGLGDDLDGAIGVLDQLGGGMMRLRAYGTIDIREAELGHLGRRTTIGAIAGQSRVAVNVDDQTHVFLLELQSNTWGHAVKQ